MRKLLTIIICFVLAAGMSACGGSDDNDQNGGNTGGSGSTDSGEGSELVTGGQGNGETDGGGTGFATEPLDDIVPGNYFGGPGAAADVSDTYTENQMDLVEQLKSITQSNDLGYEFEIMYPVVKEDGDYVKIYFSYNNPFAMGGSPVALVSKEDNEIVRVYYTQ